MKFVVAIGLLTQVPSVLSHKSDVWTTPVPTATTKFQGHVQHRSKIPSLHAKRRSLKLKAKALRNNFPGVLKNLLCDPTETEADTGILSCGEGRTCVPFLGSDLNGICVSKLPKENGSGTKQAISGPMLGKARWMKPDTTSTNLVPCDPEWIDIGILACGEGKICKSDKASDLGGFCFATPVSSRHLYTVDRCDPASPFFYDFCDCTGLDTTSGTGVISCLPPESFGDVYPGCEDTIVSTSTVYTFEGSNLISYRYCIEAMSPYYQKFCQGYNVAIASCIIEFNGQVCNTCSIIEGSSSFDCSNIEGGGSGNSLLQGFPIFAQCYTGPSTYTCTSLCASGDYIPFENYSNNVTTPELGEISCAALGLAEASVSIPDNLCPLYTAAAQSGCCEYQCDLCGQTAIVSFEKWDTPVSVSIQGYEGFTCGDFANAAYANFSIPASTCLSIGDVVQQTCCEATVSDCNICGGEFMYPTAIVTLEDYQLSCDSLPSFLTSTECDAVSPLVFPTCCGATSATPSMTPVTGAPTPSLPGPSSPSQPGVPTESSSSVPAPLADGATTLFSIKTAASVLSLAVALFVLAASI